jgi:hypothetical protein
VSDLVIKLKGDGDYPLDINAALADLTGDETAMVEDYLGGWDNFDLTGNRTARSLIVTVWLAKRQAGKTVTLEEVAATKGLMFGDVLDMDVEDDTLPPAQAADEAATRSTPATSEPIGTGV